MTARRADERRALSDAVMARVAGRGISRKAVDDVVGRVLDTLAAAERSRAPSAAAGSVVAALTARSVPDLASRIRRDLEGAGIVIEEMGIGSAGQHTVVTVRLPASARSDLERLAERSTWSLSFLNPHDSGATLE
ncbi:MAG TPA: hypothetical protein VJ672_14965 [Gemmatimonadaceae bacterium]|nr:hypothetical protein [Gemmatimonadaceae bacterium]